MLHIPTTGDIHGHHGQRWVLKSLELHPGHISYFLRPAIQRIWLGGDNIFWLMTLVKTQFSLLPSYQPFDCKHVDCTSTPILLDGLVDSGTMRDTHFWWFYPKWYIIYTWCMYVHTTYRWFIPPVATLRFRRRDTDLQNFRERFSRPGMVRIRCFLAKDERRIW